MTSKTFADLEKEIGCRKFLYNNFNNDGNIWKCGQYGLRGGVNTLFLCEGCQAKQDLLKEVKKIIANGLDNFQKGLKLSEMNPFCIDAKIIELKSKLGLTSEEKD